MHLRDVPQFPMYPYQTVGVQFLSEQKGAILADDMGLGKMQPVDSLVATPTGWKPIGEIIPGDYVIGSNGLPTQVQRVFPQGIQRSYRVTFSNGESVEAGDRHIWTLYYRKGGRKLAPIELTTRQLLERPRLNGLNLARERFFLPIIQPVEFGSDYKMELPPYTLGVLIANGGLAHRGTSVSCDPKTIECIQASILAEGIDCAPIKTRSYGTGTSATFNLRGTAKTIRDLKLDVVSRKKFIPQQYQTASVADRIALLQGLMDCDGNISATRNKISYSTTSEQLAQDVLELVESLGGIGEIWQYPIKDTVNIEYRVRMRFGNGIQPFRVAPKAERYRPGIHANPTRSVLSVEYVRDVEQVCIEVDAEDQLYATEHYILTHNCRMSLTAAVERGFKKILVICLNANKYTWQGEIDKWLEDATSVIIEGKEPERIEQIKQRADFTIISFNQIRSLKKKTESGATTVVKTHVDLLANYRYDLIIIDEAHTLRNRKSKMFKSAKQICAYHRGALWALTGTPVHTHPEDLWAILHTLRPGTYTSFWKWAELRCTTAINRFSGYKEVTGVIDAAKIREEISPFTLRRTKEDHLNLPPKTYVNIPVDLTPEHRKAYSSMKRKFFVDYKGHVVDAVGTLAQMVRLKQIAISPDLFIPATKDYTPPLEGAKIDAILEIIYGIGDQKFIIFSQFATLIRRLQDSVNNIAKVVSFTGDTPNRERQKCIDRVQNDDKIRGIMMTYGSGGVGTTITRPSIVILPDLMWAPAANRQAVDRTHRIGQENPVTVYSIHATNTVEDYILQVLGGREMLFDMMIPTADVTSAALEYLSRGE